MVRTPYIKYTNANVNTNQIGPTLVIIIHSCLCVCVVTIACHIYTCPDAHAPSFIVIVIYACLSEKEFA